MRSFVQISSKVHSAITLLTFVAEKESRFPVSLSLISEYLNLSRRYLDKVAKPLKMAGFLKSFQGSAGGYKLAKKNISMLDVIESIEGPIRVLHCVGANQCNVKHKCPSKNIWPAFQKEIIKTLKNTKIV